MSLILPALAATAGISIASSTLVGVYSVWRFRQPNESVFARNARLDREALDRDALDLHSTSPGLDHSTRSTSGA